MIVKQEIIMNEIANILNDTKEVVIRAKGRSMSPYIRDGIDSLVIQKADTSKLKVGDVILAKLNAGHYVMHRIIKMEQGVITLKGDGNLYGTEQCTADDVIGRLAYVEKNGKRIDCNTKKERAKAWIMRTCWRSTRKAKNTIKKIYDLR